MLDTVPPDSIEKISYGVAGYKVSNKNCVFFAGFKSHVSIYPLISAPEDLEADAKPFRSGKATIKFPLDKPVPNELIARIAKYLVDRRLAGEG